MLNYVKEQAMVVLVPTILKVFLYFELLNLRLSPSTGLAWVLQQFKQFLSISLRFLALVGPLSGRRWVG